LARNDVGWQKTFALEKRNFINPKLIIVFLSLKGAKRKTSIQFLGRGRGRERKARTIKIL
jgi:hypothetical protein